MEQERLETFVRTALRDRRIRFGDVRRLQRQLPDGIASRAEVETLLALDRSVPKPDPLWTAFLVDAVRRFVVERMEPIGMIDAPKAEWLLTSLRAPTPKTAAAIAREVAIEAREGDEAAGAFAAATLQPADEPSGIASQSEVAPET